MEYMIVLTLLASLLSKCEPHGYMFEPAQRSSIWRFDKTAPHNFNDMSLYCGGYKVQWEDNEGKCGVCGDPYNGERKNEAGGIYAKGVIVQKYTSGQVIRVGVRVTAFHLGYFQFKICPHNNPTVPVSQECLDQQKLKLAGTNEYRFYPTKDGDYYLQLQLPANMTCSQCVLQWNYTNWNTPDTYKQETFINCADVAISNDSSTSNVSTSPTWPTTAPKSDCQNGYIKMCHGEPAEDTGFQRHCNENCREPNINEEACTAYICKCACQKIDCKATGPYEGMIDQDAWCLRECTLNSDLCKNVESCKCTKL
ncbi:uncharacterized protein LOC133196797 [Saccostrea echinata]|uniref:uncharacterized protein LOC133196797 n=1 Tax=Saccostrea echinata TaxID=191078 RepID=UPI002A836A23|nr:uncharacterized protein LOC133196797 [Saccostrea echinata]